MARHTITIIAIGSIILAGTCRLSAADTHYFGADAAGWDYEEYYSTIQTGDVDGDGKAELLVHSAIGMQTYKFNSAGNSWELVASGNPDWSDAEGWGYEKYYSTIQTGDVDGDGKAELLARSGSGMQTYKFNSAFNSWELVGAGCPAWSDAGGWGYEKYYSTIQTGDVDGDGKAELLVRSAIGMQTYKFNSAGNSWELVASGNPAWSDAAGWDYEKYYSTIQTGDVDGDGKAELLARGGNGMQTYRFNSAGNSWELVASGNPDWSDAGGWGDEKYYSTIQTGDIDGDGKAELLARSASGMETYRFNSAGNSWELVASGNPDWSDAGGWDGQQYYSTIQTGDVDGDGKAELLALSASWMQTYDFDANSNLWVNVSAERTEFTVLTYNTHLFEDSILEAICRCGEIPSPDSCTWSDYNYDDGGRRTQIVNRIRASAADIVALEEVWALWWQRWFIEDLQDMYPYTATVDSSCAFADALPWELNACLDGGMICAYCCKAPCILWPNTCPKKNTLGNGLVLLSKFPLSDIGFERFPVFSQEGKEGDLGTEAWSDKGILTATVKIGGAPIRIGISHALTGPDDYNSNWDTDYVAPATTTFQLNGESYIFALDKNNQAHISRFEDYGRWWDEKAHKYNSGAGWKHLYAGTWGSAYVAVTSFELDGHPYLFGLNKNNQGHITRINDDPATGWTHLYWGTWGSAYVAVTSFELDGHPYLFGLNNNNQGHITRINDDPATGWTHLYWGTWGSAYVAVTSFELEGHPYLFGLNKNNQGHITRINDDPATGWTHLYWGTWGSAYVAITSFELDGHPYLFGLNKNNQGHITRINDDPATGWTHLHWGTWSSDYTAVKSFQMNGHPYLFAQRNCCDQRIDRPECRPRPGEAYLKRIKDDPSTGWEALYQLEDIKIIRDATIVDEDGPPAIMMGDFNIHASKYGIMDQLFRKAGAVDAYIEVHGTAEGGETIDLKNNKLAPEFCEDKPETSYNDCDVSDPNVYPTEMSVDRIDYVYFKPSGRDARLVPTDANVIRDWKYGADNMDLSDHYPLVVKFRLEAGCEPQFSADFDCDGIVRFSDLAILCSAWLSGPGGTWVRACDIADPGNDFIDAEDFDAFARAWMTMLPVHNLTRDKAYASIQRAVNDANDGDQIEVAPGTYYEAINFKGKAVTLRSTDPNEPNVVAATVINGAGYNHVVQCISGENANTVLAGFTITGGNANGAGETGYGGGMYNKAASPSVTNCIFRDNKAAYGGGMLNSGSSPIITNCTFSGNSATSNSAGMHNTSGSSPTLTYCTFSGNTAGVCGGGMTNAYDSSPVITDCIFADNTANSNGGGMWNLSNSSPTVNNCTFSYNNAGQSGGGIDSDSSSPTVTNCTFTDNQAKYGGGMDNYKNSAPTVTNCTFSGNNSSVGGGGVCNSTSSSPKVTNCSFSGNQADSYGGGMYNYNSNPTVTNCILWGNTAPTGPQIYGGSPTITYSDIQGGPGGTGNINLDPLFVDASGGNLRLSSGSPCIDKGSNAAVPAGITTDLDGNPRVFDGDGNGTATVDMGAYEYLVIMGARDSSGLAAYCIVAAAWLESPRDVAGDSGLQRLSATYDIDFD
jgi:parallel beta-helix repeat protein